MRVIFMGTPDFSVPVLEALAARHEVACVYSQPPRPAGRGQKERPGPVHARALELGIPVRTPKSLRTEEAQAEFDAIDADVAVVAAYGLILPEEILESPKLGCLNVHASLLPRWRGAAPIQRAIMAGDTVTGVTIMEMEAGLDTGPMLVKREVPIGDDTTAQALHDALSQVGAELMVEALDRILEGELDGEEQPEEGITYARKIEKDEARIDFARPARVVLRHIHGLSPFPGAWCEVDGERLKILACTVEPGRPGAAPGTVLDDDLLIACADGEAVRPLSLQRAGKGALPRADLLRGFKVPAGAVLG
ncbi:methionyl-tRNA formyltransferase [Caenispirillum bisanense]|uniref:Methionyl-tRNA formyltransferase n=1 Tax=Caenispirillum bisanense TaxID=414052 RepID=A0A286G979_9PROT|nr:methionyl-tRNA formyltransferase [Caenispirillum bisanense]SOD92117.1 methionyl-tRNA formyltransferase [Caenispirillum bisanense]